MEEPELFADFSYYDRWDFLKKQEDVTARNHKGSRTMSWLRGETMEQYHARLAAAGLTAQKIYLEKEQVRLDTNRRLERLANVTYSKVHNAMPEQVQALMVPGTSKGTTFPNMPHLGYVEVFKMGVVYPDGTRSHLKFISSNFEANVVPGDDGLHFQGIPAQRDGVVNKDTFFFYGRKVNPDGTMGDLDPHFSKDGIAYRPNDLKAVAEAVFKVGKMTVLAERQLARGIVHTRVGSGAPRPVPEPKVEVHYDPTDMVIPLDGEEDAGMAMRR